MLPGIFLCLNAMGLYPPLNARLPMGFMLGVFLLPMMAHLFYSVLHPRCTDVQPWKTVYSSASALLVVLAMGLYLNGGLDRAAVKPITTVVVEKTTFKGGRSPQYNLAVTSWRPGRSLEHISVRRPLYDRAQVGRPVTINIHKGYLGLAWCGGISPE